MVTPDKIKEKATNKYNEYLMYKYCDYGKDFFPLVIKCDRKLDTDNIDRAITQFYNSSKFAKGYGYEWDREKEKTIKSRRHSSQTVPGEIFFATEYDYLRYIDKIKKKGDNTDFDELMRKTLPDFPELKELMVKKHKLVVNHAGKWNEILKVCRFFKLNPQPNMFVRELPIGVYTKFVESNKGILRPLLDIIVGNDVNKDESDFYLRFNLKKGEPEIYFRVLDKDLSDKYFSGLTSTWALINEFAKLDIPLENVIIAENKRNTNKVVELLPNKKSTFVVWGSGYKVTALKNVPWLKNVNLYYWGDIDAQGYEILSDIRLYFPDIKSIMMDKEAITVHPNNKEENRVEGTLSNVKKQLQLYDYEDEIYNFVKENNLRYEQEQLPASYMRKCLDEIL